MSKYKKTHLMFRIETLAGEDIKDYIKRLYVDEKMSLADMSDYIEEHTGVSVHYTQLGRWLKTFGIRPKRWR